MSRAYKPSQDFLQIKWRSSNYYFDAIPKIHFQRPCKNKRITHYVFWDNAEPFEYKANCKLTVRGTKAILDYRGMNREDAEIEDGRAIIQFASPSRRAILRIDYISPDGKRHEDAADSNWHLLGEVKEGERYLSEAKRLRRNAELVRRRKRQDKYTCQACEYRLQINGKHIVDCHHTEPLSQNPGTRITNIGHLVTLCPNCHRIAHTRNPPLSVEEIKKLLSRFST